MLHKTELPSETTNFIWNIRIIWQVHILRGELIAVDVSYT